MKHMVELLNRIFTFSSALRHLSNSLKVCIFWQTRARLGSDILEMPIFSSEKLFEESLHAPRPLQVVTNVKTISRLLFGYLESIEAESPRLEVLSIVEFGGDPGGQYSPSEFFLGQGQIITVRNQLRVKQRAILFQPGGVDNKMNGIYNELAVRGSLGTYF